MSTESLPSYSPGRIPSVVGDQSISTSFCPGQVIACAAQGKRRARLQLTLPVELLAAFLNRIEETGLSKSAGGEDAFKHYLYNARRARVRQSDEIIAADIARLLQLVLFAEKTAETVLKHIEGTAPTSALEDLSKLDLQLVFFGVRDELRAARRQLADHLKLLSNKDKEETP